MKRGWLRRWFQRNALATEWCVMVDGVIIATLVDPQYADMFWTSVRILPSATPADPRLGDNDFWISAHWQLVDAKTGKLAANAIASASGMPAPDHVIIRGLFT